jgi:hypothetical protein
MKAAVALAVSISLLGCFPNNARHRTYAKYGEGAALIAGIAISAVANTGADCDTDAMASTDCRTTAKWLSTAGVVLILGGLLGFVATVSTAEDDAESTPRILSREKTGPGTGSGAGSAAPTDGSGSAAPPPIDTPPADGSTPADDGTAVPQ